MATVPWYYLCVTLAVIVLGISKTGFGGGIGILAIPLMAMVMSAEQMVAVETKNGATNPLKLWMLRLKGERKDSHTNKTAIAK